MDDDPTTSELAHAIPEACDGLRARLAGTARPGLGRRGDVEVLVVDTLGEGSGFVRALERVDVEAIDVPLAGLGAAVAESQVVVLDALRRPRTTSWRWPGLEPRRRWPATLRCRCGRSPARVACFPCACGTPLRPGSTCGASRGSWTRTRSRSSLVDRLVGPGGLESVADGLRRIDCPIAPELLRSV